MSRQCHQVEASKPQGVVDMTAERRLAHRVNHQYVPAEVIQVLIRRVGGKRPSRCLRIHRKFFIVMEISLNVEN